MSLKNCKLAKRINHQSLINFQFSSALNGPVPLEAAGVVRSTSDNRWLEPTTPSAPAKEASRHFLNGRSHPSLSKEGTSAFSSVVFNAPVSSKRCGTWQAKTDNPVPPLRAGQTSVWRL